MWQYKKAAESEVRFLPYCIVCMHKIGRTVSYRTTGPFVLRYIQSVPDACHVCSYRATAYLEGRTL